MAGYTKEKFNKTDTAGGCSRPWIRDDWYYACYKSYTSSIIKQPIVTKDLRCVCTCTYEVDKSLATVKMPLITDIFSWFILHPSFRAFANFHWVNLCFHFKYPLETFLIKKLFSEFVFYQVNWVKVDRGFSGNEYLTGKLECSLRWQKSNHNGRMEIEGKIQRYTRAQRC